MQEIEELNRIDSLIIDSLEDLLLINEGSIDPVKLVKARMILRDIKNEWKINKYRLSVSLSLYDKYLYSYLSDCRDDVKLEIMHSLGEKNKKRFNEKIHSKLFHDEEIQQIISFIQEREESII